MNEPLRAGLTATREIAVDRERTIGFMGEKARVYATPALLRDIEMAARDLLLAHLPEGQDSVGTRVELDHLAATLLGMTVTLDLTVSGVEGRRVTLKVEGRDSVEPICRATHQRFVVDVASTERRLAAKAAQAGLTA